MIHGVGTDIVEVARLRRMLDRHGALIAGRILAPEEKAAFDATAAPDRFLAKRFAIKEAFAKALGTGVRSVVGLRSIVVDHDALGKPMLRFAAPLAAYLDERRLRAHASVSDEASYVVAFVVVELAPGGHQQ